MNHCTTVLLNLHRPFFIFSLVAYFLFLHDHALIRWMNSSGVPVQLAHSVDMDTLCLQTRMYNNLAGQFSWNCPGASNIYDMPTVLQQGQVLTTVDFSPATTLA